MTVPIKVEYSKRSTWMQQRHRLYGDKCHLQDVDCMWIESINGKLIALSEFKLNNEPVEIWRCKPMIELANNSNIPAFVIVGYEQALCYYVMPLNDIAKQLPTLSEPRFMSEKCYVQFLHYLRKIKPEEKTLEGLNSSVPKGLKLPNIK